MSPVISSIPVRDRLKKRKLKRNEEKNCLPEILYSKTLKKVKNEVLVKGNKKEFFFKKNTHIFAE